jgi:hypothetical protein
MSPKNSVELLPTDVYQLGKLSLWLIRNRGNLISLDVLLLSTILPCRTRRTQW